MNETELTVLLDDGLPVAGTLVQPHGEGPHPTVVVLCAGQLDREGNVGKWPIAFGRPLAAALAAHGVASYRFDRRGIGATPGNWQQGGFYQHRRDDVQVVRAIAARPDVASVGLVGLSEGAVNATWVSRHAEVAAIVLIGCPATTGVDGMVAWAEHPDAEIPTAIRLALRLLRRTPAQQLRRISDKIRRGRERVFGIKLPQWFREFLLHDTRPDIAAVQVPVLAITGDKDIQVDPDDLDKIAQLAQGPVDVHRIPGMTHMLRCYPVSTPPPTREQLREPVAPELLEEVAVWTAAKLAVQTGL
jgi:uncharacterized protein